MNDTAPAPAPTGPLRRVGHFLDTRLRSPAAIYGLLVFAAFNTIASDHEATAWEVLGTSFGSLIVFFLAHVFAHTLTDHGRHGLRDSIALALQHSGGMLYASIPAALTLAIGASQGMSGDDASDASMWVTLGVLAILGYVAYARRGAHVAVRLLGALGTALLGMCIVLLEYIIH